MKKKSLFTIVITFKSFLLLSQYRSYERYDGPRDTSLGVKCLFYGILLWCIGMLIGLALKKKNGVLEEGQSFLLSIVGILVVLGVITFLFGLIMIGF